MTFALLFALVVLGSLVATTFGPRVAWLVRFALASVAVLIVISPASATPLNLPQSTIDQLSQLGAALIVALGMMLWKWFETHSPLAKSQAGEVARQAAMLLLDKSGQFGATQIKSGLTKVGNVDVGNAAIAAGANFALAHGSDLLKAVGFDTQTDAGRDAIIRMVTLRLGTILDPSAGPVPTPLALPAGVALSGSPTSPTGQLVPPPAKND